MFTLSIASNEELKFSILGRNFSPKLKKKLLAPKNVAKLKVVEITCGLMQT
jgi:hypothetical protein